MSKAWKQPTVVEGHQVPGNRSTDPDRIAFLEDVLKRLEATPAAEALRYPFCDERQRNLYASYAVGQINKARGKGSVTTRKAVEVGVAIFYIRRGPNWGK